MAFIYMITNIHDGKVYIGQTLRTPLARWKSHLVQARRGDNEYFHRAIRVHGEQSFTLMVLEEVADDSVNEREIAIIALHRATDRDKGYNVAAGGRHAKHTPETCSAISARMMGNKCGLGKSPSEEHRKKLSECKKGNTYALGCVRSSETRKRMSEASKGRIVSPETCAKIAAAKKGKPQAEEHRIACARGRIGLKRGMETKAKMAEARRLWWAKKKILN